MSITKISDHVYSVGVINPSLRVFDIVMEAKYGTSYNAYLVTGEKNVLIDTVHTDFFDEYLYNISCLVDIESIDAIIVNHTELDHSGSLKKLLELNPSITVVCTAVAQKYLKAILNKDFLCKTVRHQDVLTLGGTEFKFIVAPLLHWPDSMMAYLKEDKTLFSCDFLGCHFCEPTMLDENIRYRDAYLQEFHYYYQGIFSPFKPYVLAGLDKIKDLELQFVCPSHGPVLTKEIKERMDEYRNWSTVPSKTSKTMLILYASAYGCTKQLAEAAFDAVKEKTDITPEICDMVTTPVCTIAEKIASADALLVGSCTINRDAPKVVWDVLSSVDAIGTRGKVAGAFGSYGWSAEAVEMIKTRLSQLKYNFFGDGIKANFMPSDEDLQSIKEYAIGIASEIK